jgi:hypothetical protein
VNSFLPEFSRLREISHYLSPMIEQFINQKSGPEPHDLAMLERVLDEVLRRRSIAKGTEAASKIAGDIISLCEHEIRNGASVIGDAL